MTLENKIKEQKKIIKKLSQKKVDYTEFSALRYDIKINKRRLYKLEIELLRTKQSKCKSNKEYDSYEKKIKQIKSKIK